MDTPHNCSYENPNKTNLFLLIKVILWNDENVPEIERKKKKKKKKRKNQAKKKKKKKSLNS